METMEKIVVAIGGGAAALALYFNTRLNKVASSVGSTVEKLASKVTVDIENTIVEKAIQLAVDREVGSAVGSAANAAVNKVRQDMSVRVMEAVDKAYDSLSEAVSNEIAIQVSRIDQYSLAKDVKEKAKAAILEKFDDNLDDILEDFKGNLAHVSKIYGSISETLSRKPEKEMTFKIG